MIDVVGYVAASLVLATFCMRSMRSLRLVALASNLAFIAYGYLGNLTPVLVLHAVLLPVNACRLLQLFRIEFPPSSGTRRVTSIASSTHPEVMTTNAGRVNLSFLPDSAPQLSQKPKN